jgi:DNA-binding NtrC family response regulator
MIVSDEAEIRPEHLPVSVHGAQSGRRAGEDGGPGGAGEQAVHAGTLEELERAHIEAALRATEGHRARAARMLGISERNLYRKLREYGLLG